MEEIQMNVNYDTQVQPNHVLPMGIGHDCSYKSTNDEANTAKKVDKASQGAFDRSMKKEGAERASQSENQLNAAAPQQFIQQLMERLAPLIAQIVEEILGDIQQHQNSDEVGGANDVQAMADEALGLQDEQNLSPHDQLIQQIMERLMPLLEQIIQEMTGGNSSDEQMANHLPSAINPSQASHPSENIQDQQPQNSQDQLMQQIMQVLVPLIAQIVESVLASGQASAGLHSGGFQQPMRAY